MTFEESTKIDFMSVSKTSDEVRLSISDHLSWDKDEEEHLRLLQDKINAYLSFIESGEMVGRFPEMEGRKVMITVFGNYPLSARAEKAFDKGERPSGRRGLIWNSGTRRMMIEPVEKLPRIVGRRAIIGVVGKFPVDEKAEKSFGLTGKVIRHVGFRFLPDDANGRSAYRASDPT